MKLFVGLGNPGSQYLKTRHNAGFLLLDDFCYRHNATDFLYNNKFQAEVATGIYEGVQFIAVKPMNFMNRSGGPLQIIMNFYKIASEDCLIFHDDIDIPSGAIKLKFGGSHGGHNGIRDIYAKTATESFWKLKYGVGRPENTHILVADYVLGTLTEAELQALRDAHHEIDQKVQLYIKNTGK